MKLSFKSSNAKIRVLEGALSAFVTLLLKFQIYLKIPQIIDELFITADSERSGRLIDHDEPNSMEEKKVMGYF